jgi:hypothetical protein
MPPSVHKLPGEKYRRDPVLGRKGPELWSLREEEGVGHGDKGIGTFSHDRVQHTVQLVAIAHRQGLEFHA